MSDFLFGIFSFENRTPRSEAPQGAEQPHQGSGPSGGEGAFSPDVAKTRAVTPPSDQQPTPRRTWMDSLKDGFDWYFSGYPGPGGVILGRRPPEVAPEGGAASKHEPQRRKFARPYPGPGGVIIAEPREESSADSQRSVPSMPKSVARTDAPGPQAPPRLQDKH
jgi:hypothetical protein